MHLVRFFKKQNKTYLSKTPCSGCKITYNQFPYGSFFPKEGNLRSFSYLKEVLKIAFNFIVMEETSPFTATKACKDFRIAGHGCSRAKADLLTRTRTSGLNGLAASC